MRAEAEGRLAPAALLAVLRRLGPRCPPRLAAELRHRVAACPSRLPPTSLHHLFQDVAEDCETDAERVAVRVAEHDFFSHLYAAGFCLPAVATRRSVLLSAETDAWIAPGTTRDFTVLMCDGQGLPTTLHGTLSVKLAPARHRSKRATPLPVGDISTVSGHRRHMTFRYTAPLTCTDVVLCVTLRDGEHIEGSPLHLRVTPWALFRRGREAHWRCRPEDEHLSRAIIQDVDRLALCCTVEPPGGGPALSVPFARVERTADVAVEPAPAEEIMAQPDADPASPEITEDAPGAPAGDREPEDSEAPEVKEEAEELGLLDTALDPALAFEAQNLAKPTDPAPLDHSWPVQRCTPERGREVDLYERLIICRYAERVGSVHLAAERFNLAATRLMTMYVRRDKLEKMFRIGQPMKGVFRLPGSGRPVADLELGRNLLQRTWALFGPNVTHLPFEFVREEANQLWEQFGRPAPTQAWLREFLRKHFIAIEDRRSRKRKLDLVLGTAAAQTTTILLSGFPCPPLSPPPGPDGGGGGQLGAPYGGPKGLRPVDRHLGADICVNIGLPFSETPASTQVMVLSQAQWDASCPPLTTCSVKPPQETRETQTEPSADGGVPPLGEGPAEGDGPPCKLDPFFGDPGISSSSMMDLNGEMWDTDHPVEGNTNEPPWGVSTDALDECFPILSDVKEEDTPGDLPGAVPPPPDSLPTPIDPATSSSSSSSAWGDSPSVSTAAEVCRPPSPLPAPAPTPAPTPAPPVLVSEPPPSTCRAVDADGAQLVQSMLRRTNSTLDPATMLPMGLYPCALLLAVSAVPLYDMGSYLSPVPPPSPLALPAPRDVEPDYPAWDAIKRQWFAHTQHAEALDRLLGGFGDDGGLALTRTLGQSQPWTPAFNNPTCGPGMLW